MAYARPRILMALVVFLISFTVSASAASPQQAAATGQRNTISGVVVDPTGAMVPEALVELQGATPDLTRSTKTDGAGVFRILDVAPGRYEVVVTFDGFQRTRIRGTVGARAPAQLRITMPLAAITQEVTVTNGGAEVTRDAASNLDASSVDQSAIENLPVFSQDRELAALQEGRPPAVTLDTP